MCKCDLQTAQAFLPCLWLESCSQGGDKMAKSVSCTQFEQELRSLKRKLKHCICENEQIIDSGAACWTWTDLADTVRWMCPNATGSTVEAPKPVLPHDVSYWHNTSTSQDVVWRQPQKENPVRNQIRGCQRSPHHPNSHCTAGMTH